MAKKYNHEKQTRKNSKAQEGKTERKPSRLLSHSPNPDENRSYPIADRRKKKLMAKKEKEEERKSTRFEKNKGDKDKFDGKKRYDERPTRGENKRPFAKKDGFRKKEGSWETTKYAADPAVRKDENGHPTAGRSRDIFDPRAEDDRAFSKGSGFKKRAERSEKKKDFTQVGNRKDARNNRADSGKRPRYNEDVMKSKLPVKVREKVIKRESKHTDGTIRLNRYIANAGVCSRREADELIAAGNVTVNGKVVTELGSRVMPEDTITYNGKTLTRENFVYVLLNKPKDFITTTDDPEERKTVMDIIAEAADERIYPVGRLDRKTTGLLLLTNDGKLAERLSHPSGNISKIYQAELDKPITEEHFDAIVAGFELEDGFIKPDELALITPDAEVVGIQIHSGKNRIVRRIFEHFGYTVKKLDRTVYAGLTKKDLPRGKWRYLSEKEVIKLKYLS